MLGPGDTAPDFDLPCVTGGRVSSLRFKDVRSQLIILFFYPRDFSFICPTEVDGFNQSLKEFETAQCCVLGVSGDSVETHLKWAEELGGINYPLLSDVEGVVAQAYGVFDKGEMVPLRATFVIGQDRKIVHALACPLDVGRSVGDTLPVVQAGRTGRLCPAHWTPGLQFGPAGLNFLMASGITPQPL